MEELFIAVIAAFITALVGKSWRKFLIAVAIFALLFLVFNSFLSPIHNYEIVIEDCTWEEARQQCIDKGGHLVRINSEKEFDYVTDLLNRKGYKDYYFYLGGRRELNNTEYYWINEENQFIGERLNRSENWLNPYWYHSEPSFQDIGSGASSIVSEDVMTLFFVSENWYLNDSSSDLPGDYPSLLSGKVGYIMEKE